MYGGFFVRRFTSWVFVNCYEKNQKTLAEVTRKKKQYQKPQIIYNLCNHAQVWVLFFI